MASPTWVTVTIPPQLSVVVTLPVFTAGTSDAHDTETPAGQVNVGTALSSTVIVCRHVLVLPHASVAVHVLLMVYS